MWFERQLKLQATTLLEKPHQNIFSNTQNPIFLRQQDDPFGIVQRSTTQITDIYNKNDIAQRKVTIVVSPFYVLKNP